MVAFAVITTVLVVLVLISVLGYFSIAPVDVGSLACSLDTGKRDFQNISREVLGPFTSHQDPKSVSTHRAPTIV